MINLAPTPDIVVEPQVVADRVSGRVTRPMSYWLLSLMDRVNAGPQIMTTVAASAQGASISATSFPILSVLPGLYRLSVSARISRAATTSSSLTVTFGWTDSTVSCTTSSAAMTGNTTST